MQHEWLGEVEYEVEVEILGRRQRVSCPYTCDRCCGRACGGEIRHSGRCDCRTDCASEAGPFDHLVASGAIPAEMIIHDTEEIPFSMFEE